MQLDFFWQYASVFIGLLGLFIGLIQGFERKKLKEFIHSQAWQIFSISNYSYATAQSALKRYKEKYGDQIDPEIFEHLSKCDAYNLSVFIESIRQIQLSEPKFDLESIMSWQMQGRINKNQSSFFLKAMPLKSPGLMFLIWNVITLNVRQKLMKYLSSQQKISAPPQDKEMQDNQNV